MSCEACDRREVADFYAPSAAPFLPSLPSFYSRLFILPFCKSWRSLVSNWSSCPHPISSPYVVCWIISDYGEDIDCCRCVRGCPKVLPWSCLWTHLLNLPALSFKCHQCVCVHTNRCATKEKPRQSSHFYKPGICDRHQHQHQHHLLV